MGYFCPEQTSDVTMYANQCTQGFFCRVGTGEASKTRDNCPQTYYCPPGTGVYDYVSDVQDYSKWRGDAPTRCPQGTGIDGSDTKTRLTQCYINVEYKLQLPVVDIRNQFDAEWRAEQERLRIVAEIAEAARKVALRLEEAGGAAAPDPAEDAEDPGGDMMGDEDKRRRLGPPMEHRKELKRHRRELRRQSAINLGRPHGRRLAIEAASKDDPRLQDLNEIEFELKQSRSGLIEPSPIRTYLNLERKSLMRINPLNITLVDQWEEIEIIDDETAKNNEPAVIFKLDPNSVMLITMDLRQIMLTEYNWVYGEDWSVSITIDKELTLANSESPQYMPEQFLKP